MSELLQSSDDEPLYGDRTLREWHDYLTTHQGEPAGHLETPGSRYGSTATDCAWWAVATLSVFKREWGEEDGDALATEFMSLAVNDSEELVEIVRDNLTAVPAFLAEKLGLAEPTEPSPLEDSIRQKFIRHSDSSLIRRMENAPDFGYDDESVELTRRLKLGGFAWRWSQDFYNPRIEVYRQADALDQSRATTTNETKEEYQ